MKRINKKQLGVGTVMVVGAGTMGHGIAQAAAMAGFRTWMYDLEESLLERARSHVEKNLKKGKELGKISEQVFQAGRAESSDHDGLRKGGERMRFSY